MNVGCNKGHDSIAWLQRFDQHRFWNLRTPKSLQKTGIRRLDSSRELMLKNAADATEV